MPDMYKDDKDTLPIEDEVLHELSLNLNETTIAFFSITYNARMIGDDDIEIVPTMITIHGRLSIHERLKVAKAIVELGQSIRRAALGNDRNSINRDEENNDG